MIPLLTVFSLLVLLAIMLLTIVWLLDRRPDRAAAWRKAHERGGVRRRS